MVKRSQKIGMPEIVEIFQYSFILFIVSMIASFLISTVFTELDKAVDKALDDDHTNTYISVKFFETFLQLFVTAVVYFYVEKTVYLFPSIASKLYRSYESWKSISYVIHIVLIVTLIEMNSSLVSGLHFIAKTLTVGDPH